MSTRPYMTPADVVLLAATLALAVALFFLMPRWVLSSGSEIEILAHDKVVGRYPLNMDRTIRVAGPLGTTAVEVKDGKARIASSPCPNKICVHMGEFGTEGGVLVCVPNEVVVRVGKEQPNGVDTVSR
jgi:hypothetical protein